MVKILGNINIVLVFLLLQLSSANAEPLSLVTASLPPIAPYSDKQGYMERIAKEAFARIGVKVEVTKLPGERALLNANSGIDDGDLLRIPGLEKKYQNLIRIPEKVMDFEFVAFTLNQDIKVNNFDDLKKYTVAYVTGWKFYENKVKHAKTITKTNSLFELFELLKKQRSDVVLAERWQGLWAATQRGVNVHLQQPSLHVSDMYIYLHKRHATLVPKVAKAIQDMKADGTFQKIVDETLGVVEKN